MSVIISNINSASTAAGAARGTAPTSNAGYAQSAKPAPAATVEISSGARLAAATGQGHAPAPKIRPLNIIWGDSPR